MLPQDVHFGWVEVASKIPYSLTFWIGKFNQELASAIVYSLGSIENFAWTEHHRLMFNYFFLKKKSM